jgi:hypothetical protein
MSLRFECQAPQACGVAALFSYGSEREMDTVHGGMSERETFRREDFTVAAVGEAGYFIPTMEPFSRMGVFLHAAMAGRPR